MSSKLSVDEELLNLLLNHRDAKYGKIIKTIIDSCKWTIKVFDSNIIKIGCKYKTIKEWEDWFNNSTEEFDTKRSDPEFDIIYKSYLEAKDELIKLI